MHIAPFHSHPSHSIHTRVENEKGLCAYILYMLIAPFHSHPSHSIHTTVENEKGLCPYIYDIYT